MSRVATLLAIAVAVAAPAAASAKPKPLGPRPPLSNTGRWLTDAGGRVVILHGFNMVYKQPPYQPSVTGFGADDADFLRRHGFNTVRLGLIYKAVEPLPGKIDHSYVRKVRATERMLAKRGIHSLIDFHQDLYNEKFSGEGWPDWAVLDDGLPAEPLTGFPATYITSPGPEPRLRQLLRQQGRAGRRADPAALRERLGEGRDELQRRPGRPRLRPAERALAGIGVRLLPQRRRAARPSTRPGSRPSTGG